MPGAPRGAREIARPGWLIMRKHRHRQGLDKSAIPLDQALPGKVAGRTTLGNAGFYQGGRESVPPVDELLTSTFNPKLSPVFEGHGWPGAENPGAFFDEGVSVFLRGGARELIRGPLIDACGGRCMPTPGQAPMLRRVGRVHPGSLVAAVLFLLVAACGDPGQGSAGVARDGKIQREDLPELDDPELAVFTGDIDKMRERGLVRALVVPSRTDFFIDSGRIKGIQAEFLSEFGHRLNAGVERESERVRIKFVPVSFDEIIPKLRSGQGDIAAAFLTRTEERARNIQFTSPFRRNVSEIVVSHSEVNGPESMDELSGRKVYVLRGSSYIEHLKAVNHEFRERGWEPITIERADSRLNGGDILELVNAGVVDMTVVDDYKARLWARVLPNLRLHEDIVIAEGNPVSWAVRPGAGGLLQELNAFSREIRQGSLLGNMLFTRYFENVEFVDNPIERSKRDRLQRYLELFRTYGAEYGFDPLALAAQAYQESQLDHDQRSHRGAVGLMQLLPSTAKDPNVGIPDIEDVENNVHAGAKYLAFLRDRYFSSNEISDWNSRALAWAAYNAGPRKIRQARAEAERMGLDPNVWFDNVEVATGKLVSREPVRYVANIYKYYVAYRLALSGDDRPL